ncbi:uncharacterized protein F4822DRAFT_432369 [Hypoxylon trugodes]|uniref:uncharacterized protein n=1 Tax=Hypoxylon trugodes TaxID=326681 RepID=UPI0021900390|nr:uncharacterized protein F4822DRAFT_432369 [Hypoxylon trugodes]KAI1385516.1 hypothetical protein F4822DRAFT_432369 [Hypoxylon trugodes]
MEKETHNSLALNIPPGKSGCEKEQTPIRNTLPPTGSTNKHFAPQATGDEPREGIGHFTPQAMRDEPYVGIGSITETLLQSHSRSEYDSATQSKFEDERNIIALLQPFSSLILDELLDFYFNTYSPRFKENPETAQPGNATSNPQDPIGSQKGEGSYKGSNNSSQLKGKRCNDKRQEDGDNLPPTKKHRPNPSSKKGVKQHFRRDHAPSLYCPTCWETFRKQCNFESHVQNRQCSSRPKMNIIGISPERLNLLQRRSNKDLSKQKQWYEIWKTLFDDETPPASPYLDSDLSRELLLLEDFMMTTGLDIVERKAREHISPELALHDDEIIAFSRRLFEDALPRIINKYNKSNNDEPSDEFDLPNPSNREFDLDFDGGLSSQVNAGISVLHGGASEGIANLSIPHSSGAGYVAMDSTTGLDYGFNPPDESALPANQNNQASPSQHSTSALLNTFPDPSSDATQMCLEEPAELEFSDGEIFALANHSEF